ncbi:MAG: helix-turn-helix domain-containing protein [Bacteroidota bacterium]
MAEAEVQDVLESIHEAGQIWRGEREAAERVVIEDPDVVSIRRSYEMTQMEFSTLLGVNVGTLRNWEQGRRVPQGPVRVLLCIAEEHPRVMLKTLGR